MTAEEYAAYANNVHITIGEEEDEKTFEEYIEDAFNAGMEEMKQQLMAKAITAHCFGFQGDALFSFRLPARNYLVGSEVKTIVIKED